ncbi:NifB/NifX family molybdenum-iron cluster-binding protein [Marinilabiliaceae bacterium ANBcel2]|nr:NifB/NifX family molybdenum-iron cluster-binding protein [Marinilabiliaceae bacterium ANBcel2]
MITVITSTADNISAPFDKRFGRAEWFCFYDSEKDMVSFQKNEFSNVSNGAGVRVAELMVEKGVKKIISGDFGPKAKEILKKFSIQMVVADKKRVEEIIELIK